MDRETKLKIVSDLVQQIKDDDRICCDLHRVEIASYVFSSFIIIVGVHTLDMLRVLQFTHNDLVSVAEQVQKLKQEQQIRDNAVDSMIANSATSEQFTNDLLQSYGIIPPSKKDPRE